MENETFEFLLSQYSDGTLDEAQRVLVEEKLRADPAARQMLAQFQKLNGVLRDGAARPPEMRWEQVARMIGEHIDERTGWPILSIGFVRYAVAAAMLLAVGMLGFYVMRANEQPQVSIAVAVAPAAELLVMGPEPEQAAGPVMADVSVGQPSGSDAGAYADDSVLVQQPMIALEGFTRPAGVH